MTRIRNGFRATGVSCLCNGKKQVFTASKEVILSAGALKSPHILMLSGIGPEQELRKHNLRVRLDMPGVGRNLQDHIDYVFAYQSSSRDLFGISFSGAVRLLKEIQRYRHQRIAMMTSNMAEAGAFLKTDPTLRRPDIQLHFVVGLLDDHGREIHAGHGYSCHACLLRPKSKGQLTLESANPLDAPAIDPAFLTHPDDIQVLKQAYRLTQTILQSESLRPYRNKELYPVNADDDNALEAQLRQRADSVYHPVGTCRMGSDKMAVVDHELKVNGIEGLRVVDASVMPTLIGGNTNAPSIMIGEKASDFILGRNIF